jgi:hypothetical protein
LGGIRKDAFEPLGLGKPISIQIYTIYTGEVQRNIFGGKPGMLVTSAVKTDIGTTEARPRALNMMFDLVKSNQYISYSAMTVGTPIVFYTQSVVNEEINVSVEMAFDRLKKREVDQLTSLFGAAAGIPIFAPAATYLMAGGTIISILKGLAELFMPGKAFFHSDIPLRFNDPLFLSFVADAYALYRSEDEAEFENCEKQIVKAGAGKEYLALVDTRTGKPYAGKAPYIITVFDGRDRSRDLKDFTPTLVSAAILDQFYSGVPTTNALNTVKEAMNLYNDLSYNKKAEEIKTRLLKITDTSSQKYLDLKLQFDAYNLGIQNDKLTVNL